MKSVCFFCSYYTAPNLPDYIKFYLSELSRHFSEVVLLTNKKKVPTNDSHFLLSKNILYKEYENEGYDFGMWYKAFQEYDLRKYDRVGLVNDSCILFKKLDSFFQWLNKEEADYYGLTDCHLINYHIQSYFIVINKRAILPVTKYFQNTGTRKDIKEVIKVYEVGLSEYILHSGFNLKAYYSFNKNRFEGDPTWFKTKELIKNGFPMIKKKILARNYGDANWREMVKLGFDPDPRNYIRLIKRMNPEGDIDKLSSDILINLGILKEVRFYSSIYFEEIYCFLSYRIKKLKRLIILMPGRE